MRKLVSIFVILVFAGSLFASPVVASTTDNSTGSSFNILDDPATQRAALRITELARQAGAGDSEALNILKSMGQDIRDVFPRGDFVGDAWNHVALTNPNDWRSRKGADKILIRDGESERLQAAAGSGLVPYRDPAPALSRNLLVTRDVGTPIQNEPYLCVNPEDSQHIVVASHNYGYRASPAQVSFDAGSTWTTARRVPISEESVFSGDPVVACGRNDKIYYNFMSLGGQSYVFKGEPISLINSDIVVSASEDGGFTWQQPSIVATNNVAFVKIPLIDPKTKEPLRDPDTGEAIIIEILATSFLDKNWMTLGPSPTDPDMDVLYVSYTEFASYYQIVEPIPGIYSLISLEWTSEIKVHSSADEGKTWQQVSFMSPMRAIVNNPANPDPDQALIAGGIRKFNYRVVQGSQLAVAPDGTVYASWYDSGTDGPSKGWAYYIITSSSDLGKTWSVPTRAALAREIARNSRTVPFRTPANPSMAVGPSGDVYLVFPGRTLDRPEDDADIYFVRGVKDDEGNLKFTKPTIINQDDTNNIQFFPAIATGPDGAIHVMWGDTRDDPGGLKYNIYYTRSDDQGETWGFEIQGIREPDTRVTDFINNPNKGFPRGSFIGDYFGIAATADDVYMVWTDTRLGEYGPFNSKIAFARTRSMQSPSVFLNPPSGPSGQAVSVQAHGFQPDMTVFVRVGSNISTCGRTNVEGFVSCQALMPIMASEGTQNVMVFDESGNAAISSFFAEVGIDDLARIGEATSAITDYYANVEEPESSDDLFSEPWFFYVFVFGLGTGIVFLLIISWLKNRQNTIN